MASPLPLMTNGAVLTNAPLRFVTRAVLRGDVPRKD